MCPEQSVKARLPEHLEERTARFRTVLHHLIQDKGFHASQVACMDELFLHLTPLAAKEQKSCTGGLVKYSGYSGATATVILCATADGKLLPPLLILKVKYLQRCSRV